LWSPQKFRFIERYFDEFYLFIHFLIERHFLNHTGGTFSENFYGIERIPIISSSHLNWRLKCLIIHTLVPYAAKKFDDLHKRISRNVHIKEDAWNRLFTKLYSIIRSLFMGLSFVFYVAYVFSLTRTSSPFLYFSGTQYRRIFTGFPSISAKSGFFTRILKTIPSLIGRLFTYAMFLAQFYNYYSTDDVSSQFGLVSLANMKPAVPHPSVKVNREQEMLSTMETGKCPICHNARRNDAVLSVSGYIFCYSCIHPYLSLNGHCPVTSLPAKTDQLIRVYHC